MTQQKVSRDPIVSDRIRRIDGKGFSFIPHRFLREGFFVSLNHTERDLYFFLVLAGDRHGISFYHYDSICSTLQMTIDDYLQTRNSLIQKDLIAFDGTRYQVLSLPQRPIILPTKALTTDDDFEKHDPATVRLLARRSIIEAEENESY